MGKDERLEPILSTGNTRPRRLFEGLCLLNEREADEGWGSYDEDPEINNGVDPEDVTTQISTEISAGLQRIKQLLRQSPLQPIQILSKATPPRAMPKVEPIDSNLSAISTDFLEERVFLNVREDIVYEGGRPSVSLDWRKKFMNFLREANSEELRAMAQKVFLYVSNKNFPFFFSMIVPTVFQISLPELSQEMGVDEKCLRIPEMNPQLLLPAIVAALQYLQRKCQGSGCKKE